MLARSLGRPRPRKAASGARNFWHPNSRLASGKRRAQARERDCRRRRCRRRRRWVQFALIVLSADAYLAARRSELICGARSAAPAAGRVRAAAATAAATAAAALSEAHVSATCRESRARKRIDAYQVSARDTINIGAGGARAHASRGRAIDNRTTAPVGSQCSRESRLATRFSHIPREPSDGKSRLRGGHLLLLWLRWLAVVLCLPFLTRARQTCARTLVGLLIAILPLAWRASRRR